VHGIVSRWGGDIAVESGQGLGTSFSVFLPLIEEEQGESVQKTELLWLGNEKVLFVDDEPFQVDLMERMLGRLGYTVITETDSLKALEVFKDDPYGFDLVITDMTMPGLTGDELAGKILAQRADIPIIISTGYSERITEKKAKALGIAGFVMKPVIMKEIAKLIRRVLDRE
jgi:CheY-like chemotaxis protein